MCVCISQSAAAAPSPVLGNLPPGDGMPVGPVPPGFFQVCEHTDTHTHTLKVRVFRPLTNIVLNDINFTDVRIYSCSCSSKNSHTHAT